ncbi:MAG TPA: hypothetical protein VGW34_10615 [Allosphingosinicella sp.]|nr:hypothetical protein [Allosphingosinicella sp.]
MRFEDRVYENVTVYLDGNEYYRCSFVDCRLVYQGGRVPVIQEGQGAIRCVFAFEGPAANTMTFVKALADPRSGVQDVVERAIPELFQMKADFG